MTGAMLTPDVFHRLRAAQQRAVREQEVWSGRNWILICGVAHFLAASYPLFLWFHVWTLHSQSAAHQLHPGIRFGITVATGLVLVGFWWWANYAPFRAALWAVLTYLVVQGVVCFLDPHQLLVGAAMKALVVVGLLQAVRVGFRRHRPL